jgi:hypothetical protein
VADAGLILRGLLAIEGPGTVLADLEPLESDRETWSALLALIERLESEPALLGLSSHIMAVAHRPRRSVESTTSQEEDPGRSLEEEPRRTEGSRRAPSR